ncbi:flagellar assembly protein FliH [Bacillus alkalicellulosilyticus]|uniref:flagellar assembly protein FliH n=1 Tax=Alkalihalobacterium alkalicellulosilyticum TaxID=1912214 RepID=UPI0014824579|nr:flagellar assembly protein FliH [Bacillus alkalicellulosilyticus]
MSKLIKSPFTNETNTGTITIKVKQLQELQEASMVRGEASDANDQPNQTAILLLEEAKQQAEMIIKNGQEEIEQLRSQLEYERQQTYDDLEAMKQEAMQQGYQQGFAQGEMAGKEQCNELISEAYTVIEASKKDYIDRVEKAEAVIIDLALAISKKMIPQIITENNEAWSSLLKEAINEVRDHSEVKVFVHPTMYERTLQHKDELLNLLNRSEELYIYPDSSLYELDCILETPFGRVDASVDSQLSEIKAHLHERLKEGAHERS